MDDEYIDAALERIDIIGQSGFLIYALLHRYQDADGMIQTTQMDLAAKTGLAIATVNRAVRDLRISGLIRVQRHKHTVTTFQIIKSRNSIIDNTSTTLINYSINNIVNNNNEHIKNRISRNDNLKNGRFDQRDAQALIASLTHWPSIPGNPDAVKHLLGIVQDIHDKQKDKTTEYLQTFWDEFKKRYPRSTQTFWLTDWAVQGVIPEVKGAEKPKRVSKLDAEIARLKAEEAERGET